MQSWPSFLPSMQGNPTEQIKGNIISSDGDGRKSQRQRYRTGLTTVAARFLFSSAQFAAFEYFHNIKLNNGADWFLGKYYKQNSGPTDAQMRMIDGKYSASAVGVKSWEVSIDFEVKY